jgi:hypothetical protein
MLMFMNKQADDLVYVLHMCVCTCVYVCVCVACVCARVKRSGGEEGRLHWGRVALHDAREVQATSFTQVENTTV